MPAAPALSAAEGPVPHLPLTSTTARVLAVDGAGQPALTLNEMGQGEAILSAYPLEVLLTYGFAPHRWSEAHRLYRALRAEAGITPPFDAGTPGLELAVLEGEGATLLVTINHTDEPLEEIIRPAWPPVQVVEVEGGTVGRPAPAQVTLRDGGFPVSLGAHEVRVYDVTQGENND